MVLFLYPLGLVNMHALIKLQKEKFMNSKKVIYLYVNYNHKLVQLVIVWAIQCLSITKTIVNHIL